MQEYKHIKDQDTEVYEVLIGEEHREAVGLELIPSENYVSRAVFEANGSVFQNKYSEGYPGKRYYGGQDFTDQIEQLAINRACALFSAKFANVQPLSGAPANLAVYSALLKPGDTVLGMDLSHGGHLTHGHPMTHPAKIYNFVTYKMKDADTGEIDFDEMLEVAKREKPKLIVAGFSAYSRELDYAKFVEIAKEVGAYTMADMCHISGMIAGKALANPFDAGFDVMVTTTHKSMRGPRGAIILTREDKKIAKKINTAVFPGLQGGPHMHQVAAKAVAFGEALSPKFEVYAKQVLKNAKAMEAVFLREGIRLLCGGTDNHLLLADLTELEVSGAEAQTALDECGITLNKNSIADDPRGPMDPSGIRFGTPAITTRGFKEEQCAQVAEFMIEVLRDHENQELKERVREDIESLCKKYPIPETMI